MIKAAVVLAVLGGIYGILYYLNHQTPVPKGCTKIENCEGCKMTSCYKHPEHTKEENDHA